MAPARCPAFPRRHGLIYVLRKAYAADAITHGGGRLQLQKREVVVYSCFAVVRVVDNVPNSGDSLLWVLRALLHVAHHNVEIVDGLTVGALRGGHSPLFRDQRRPAEVGIRRPMNANVGGVGCSQGQVPRPITKARKARNSRKLRLLAARYRRQAMNRRRRRSLRRRCRRRRHRG